MIVIAVVVLGVAAVARGAETKSEPGWRALPLITNGKVDGAWAHTGWGRFVVERGALRTDCDPRGLGLLVYKKEKLGNCQIRVVFKTKETNCNSGVYVRIDDGILQQLDQNGAAFDRGPGGKISEESMAKMKQTSEREEGPWFAVHRGFEVQIMDTADNMHRTGAIYSLAPSSAAVGKPDEWRTMIITLDGNRLLVDVDGRRVTSFDSASADVLPRKQWHEPKRESKRPQVGYLGLQNHDPGDVVWFKEVSVRPLPKAGVK